MKIRNKKGQYTRGRISVGTIIAIIVIIFLVVVLTIAKNKDLSITEGGGGDNTYTQEASEDPRIDEYLRGEDARNQAKLVIYEQDRLVAIEANKANNSKIEQDYQTALKLEKERHAQEMLKINANLDSVRKATLQSSH